jgi:hypothetical protein
MATTATRDFPLLLCRIGFVLALAGIAAVWWRLSADDRFYAIIIAVAGSFALGLATSFHAFCSTLAVFGWVTIGFALFTLGTGYSVGWRTVRVVESASHRSFDFRPAPCRHRNQREATRSTEIVYATRTV